ncbi:MAG: RNA methyltransferase [Bacillota bacterium]|nr:RNA methyltransferase [Bacillota bacterium]MDW7684958.1 RNA methyltransferase [Bacillota bacterium]
MIESAQNQTLKLYRSLEKRKNREELGVVPLEGARLIADAVGRGIVPQTVLLAAGREIADFPFLGQIADKARFITVAEKLFAQTAFTESPQGILAIVNQPVWTVPDLFAKEPAFLLVADGVQDPGNLGTMLRSATAAGAGGAVLLPGTVDAANPKALRAAMGAYFAIPTIQWEPGRLLDELKSRGIRLVTTAIESRTHYEQYDWTMPVAVVIGNEGTGVSAMIAEAADTDVSVPMAGAMESLNAAVAMSVIFFEASRQRRIL